MLQVRRAGTTIQVLQVHDSPKGGSECTTGVLAAVCEVCLAVKGPLHQGLLQVMPP